MCGWVSLGVLVMLHFPCFAAQKVSERVSEGFLKGPRPCLSRRTLQNAFKNPPKTFREGVETDDALGFPALKDEFQGPGVL